MPTVSIIVPNYNHAPYLGQRIESILGQTFQDFELILLDDCSTDDSRAILMQYASDPRVRMAFNETNSGSTFRQWTKGIQMSRGKYIWFAESDDYADKHLLERLVGVLEEDEKIAFAYCRSWYVDESGNLEILVDEWKPHDNPGRWNADYVADGHEECLNYFTYDNIVSNASSAVFRRAAWDEVGGVDETMRTSGDWKLWAAMAMTGKVAYLSQPLNYYRRHGHTVRSRMSAALIISEQLQSVSWILKQATPSRAALVKAGAVAAPRWVPVVLSSHVPLPVRIGVLRNAFFIDPQPIRHSIRPALAVVRLKVRRHWRELRSFVAREPAMKAQ